MNDIMTLGMHRGWKRRTAALASRSLPGMALDVSTGTGDLAFQLARRPEVDRAVALDLLAGQGQAQLRFVLVRPAQHTNPPEQGGQLGRLIRVTVLAGHGVRA